jgi:hypothetical protein
MIRVAAASAVFHRYHMTVGFQPGEHSSPGEPYQLSSMALVNRKSPLHRLAKGAPAPCLRPAGLEKPADKTSKTDVCSPENCRCPMRPEIDFRIERSFPECSHCDSLPLSIQQNSIFLLLKEQDHTMNNHEPERSSAPQSQTLETTPYTGGAKTFPCNENQTTDTPAGDVYSGISRQDSRIQVHSISPVDMTPVVPSVHAESPSKAATPGLEQCNPAACIEQVLELFSFRPASQSDSPKIQNHDPFDCFDANPNQAVSFAVPPPIKLRKPKPSEFIRVHEKDYADRPALIVMKTGKYEFRPVNKLLRTEEDLPKEVFLANLVRAVNTKGHHFIWPLKISNHKLSRRQRELCWKWQSKREPARQPKREFWQSEREPLGASNFMFPTNC